MVGWKVVLVWYNAGMNMTTPLITIGITAHNAAATITRAVDSALAQDWPDTEILIYDDASADDTPEIIKKREAEKKNIRVISGRKNKGVAHSRNRLIEHAKGDFLTFFDDDDVSDPRRVKRQHERITRYEREHASDAPVICHTARTQIYPDGVYRYEATMGTAEGGVAPHGEEVAARILTGRKTPGIFGSTATCSQMARISTYRDLGGFDEDFRRGEDTDLNIRLAFKGGHFVGIEEPLVTQTMTLASDKKLDEELACTLRLLDKHKDFINKTGSHDFCVAWTRAKYEFLHGRRGAFLAKLAALFARAPVQTAQRLIWALPNTEFNVRLSTFHDGQK